MNTSLFRAALIRAFRTLIQVASSAAVTAIGTATTLGEVDWKYVASTAALSAIISVLMSFATGLPEVNNKPDVDEGHPA